MLRSLTSNLIKYRRSIIADSFNAKYSSGAYASTTKTIQANPSAKTVTGQ